MISFLGTKRDSGLEAQKCWDVTYEGPKGRESESRMLGRDHQSRNGHQMRSWAAKSPRAPLSHGRDSVLSTLRPPARSRPAQSLRAFLQSAMPTPVSAAGERLTPGSLLGGQVSGSRVQLHKRTRGNNSIGSALSDLSSDTGHGAEVLQTWATPGLVRCAHSNDHMKHRPCFLCVRCCSNCFSGTDSFDPHSNRWVLLLLAHLID